MSKYTKAYKWEVVECYKEGKVGFKALGKELGLHPAMISRWLALFEHHGVAVLHRKHEQ